MINLLIIKIIIMLHSHGIPQEAKQQLSSKGTKLTDGTVGRQHKAHIMMCCYGDV